MFSIVLLILPSKCFISKWQKRRLIVTGFCKQMDICCFCCRKSHDFYFSSLLQPSNLKLRWLVLFKKHTHNKCKKRRLFVLLVTSSSYSEHSVLLDTLKEKTLNVWNCKLFHSKFNLYQWWKKKLKQIWDKPCAGHRWRWGDSSVTGHNFCPQTSLMHFSIVLSMTCKNNGHAHLQKDCFHPQWLFYPQFTAAGDGCIQLWQFNYPSLYLFITWKKQKPTDTLQIQQVFDPQHELPICPPWQ